MQERYPIKYNENYTVNQANELIRFKQGSMTEIESKLLRLAISQIAKQDTDLRTYTCQLSELADCLGIPRSNAYRALQDIGTKLLKRIIYVPKGTYDKKGNPNYYQFQWVSMIEYDNGTVTIRLHENLKPYLLELNALFTEYSMVNILSLPTHSSIRLYELLCSFQNLLVRGQYQNWTDIPLSEKEIIFDIPYLRRFYDAENKYPNTGDFVRRLIDPSVKAINEKTTMKASYRIIKKRKITHVVFCLNDWSNRDE